ncbi:SDR family oxidoreductase [Sphingomonas sp. 67-41]|jgi:3-oxoacyl-[acyl-carrier protein] reductase|uniref:SDR family oxidoreductase n=1 Tax=Sphingomonas TaxID=13687 RepID=UPI0009647D95|nr:SDR family oxidoreductase [Sphingomonas sp. 67-41]OJY53913.1 MAG: short-chain dehydrogenase [Sphingomonas sp. 67-41]
MDFGIRDKVAFVSGGSKGMVREAAVMLADEGAKIAIVARTQGPIDETVELIRSRGGTAMGYSADLTTRAGVRDAVAAVTAEFGAPDIAISCVMENIAGDFEDVKDEDFERFFIVYAMSVVYLAREVIPAMKEKGWGRFVAVGSGTAKEPVGNIHHMLANTTRPAAVGFVKTLSDEVAKYGITCNTVGPGWIGTDNMYNYLEKKMGIAPDKVGEFLHDLIPAGRVGRPEEIASTIAYLCSDLAGYISGNWIGVDGGKHKSLF